jgi:hypothetical protein
MTWHGRYGVAMMRMEIWQTFGKIERRHASCRTTLETIRYIIRLKLHDATRTTDVPVNAFDPGAEHE